MILKITNQEDAGHGSNKADYPTFAVIKGWGGISELVTAFIRGTAGGDATLPGGLFDGPSFTTPVLVSIPITVHTSAHPTLLLNDILLGVIRQSGQ